jgi:phosphoglycolate phosphatase
VLISNRPCDSLLAMSDVDLLIWDLDGTLIDSRRDIADCVNWTLQDMGLETIPHEHIYRYVGHGVRALIQGAVEEAHGQDYDTAMKIFDTHYRAHLLDHTQLYEGLLDVLEYYRTKQMAIITNKPQRYTDPIIEGLELKPYFGAILGREACIEMKPHPQPVFKVMELLPAAAERTVIIGDTEIDIEAGRRAGIRTCGVLFGFGNEESVRAAAPDYLVEQPLDLKSIFINGQAH